MLHNERNGMLYDCRVQATRQVDEGAGTIVDYQRADSLEWRSDEHLSFAHPAKQPARLCNRFFRRGSKSGTTRKRNFS